MLGVGIALGGVALGAKAIAGDFRSKLPQREPETRWIVMLGRAGFSSPCLALGQGSSSSNCRLQGIRVGSPSGAAAWLTGGTARPVHVPA